MRLSDKSETRVPDSIRAELDAIDATLEGGSAPAGMEDLALLTNELRAMRPDEDADFAAALDAWAAAGFPRDTRPGLASPDAGGTGLGARLLSWLEPRRLAPVGVVAAGAVVVVVAISQVGEFRGNEPRSDGEAVVASSADDGGKDATPGDPGAFGLEAGTQEKSFGRDGADFAALTPGRQGFTAGRSSRSFSNAYPLAGALTQDVDTIDNRQGPLRGVEERRVERDADLVLSAAADEVQEVTNEAIAVVRGHRGIVILSQSTIGQDSSRATLQLVIPTETLDTAISDLSDLADVKSLSEGSLDITRPFVDAKDRLAGLRAERQGVFAALKVAGTEAELDALRIRLAWIQNDVAKAESEFDNIQRRARLSNVTLQITSEGADLSDDWSFSEALEDAGKVLTVAAGVALISAAVLIPLALIAAIAFLLAGWARNRSRERTLDE